MNGLDLFSGIGGISLALKPWVRTVAYCEKDGFAQGVLLSRMADGRIDRAPIWDDVTSLSGSMLPSIDIIFGGFPCQDISVAGRGVGLVGERSGLFFEIMRLAEEIKPSFIFLENVPAIRTRGADRVGLELAARGYDCRWHPLSAQEIGANHKRERWFLLAAHTNRLGIRNQSRWFDRTSREGSTVSLNNGAEESLADSDGLWKSSGAEGWHEPRNGAFDSCKDVADSDSIRRSEGRTRAALRERGPDSDRSGSLAHTLCERLEESGRVEGWPSNPFANSSWWSVEPNVGRVAHGIPKRVDRLRCLGNAVVPAQARQAFKELAGL